MGSSTIRIAVSTSDLRQTYLVPPPPAAYECCYRELQRQRGTIDVQGHLETGELGIPTTIVSDLKMFLRLHRIIIP